MAIIPQIRPWMFLVLFVVNRWVHIVGMTLLVGGILFFEFVVPLALEDLTEEQRLAVSGRMRWVFRKVIWSSVICILLSGAISTYFLWDNYTEWELSAPSIWVKPKPWFLAHAALGILGALMAIRLISGRSPMNRPVAWMRWTLWVLITCILVAAVTRYVHLHLHDVEDVHKMISG